MAYRAEASDRVRAAFVAIVLQALLGYALVVWLVADHGPTRLREALKRFNLTDAAPPPPAVETRSERTRRAKGAAAPPNLLSRASEIVAPPVVPLIPPPVIAAPIQGTGSEASQGASEVAGPGTGAGGFGDGSGSGGVGDGDGDDESPPRQVRGRLKDSDYPREAGEAGVGGTVSVRYRVDPDGRARDCRVAHSSGSGALDATTCRLIEERFRFNPSQDRYGRSVPSILVEDHEWIVHDEPRDRRF